MKHGVHYVSDNDCYSAKLIAVLFTFTIEFYIIDFTYNNIIKLIKLQKSSGIIDSLHGDLFSNI